MSLAAALSPQLSYLSLKILFIILRLNFLSVLATLKPCQSVSELTKHRKAAPLLTILCALSLMHLRQTLKACESLVSLEQPFLRSWKSFPLKENTTTLMPDPLMPLLLRYAWALRFMLMKRSLKQPQHLISLMSRRTLKNRNWLSFTILSKALIPRISQKSLQDRNL